MDILVARQVTKRFGGLVAVKRLDLTVHERSIHSIIGPNGAGKTSFFNCITGFYMPEEGEILFLGRSIRGLRPDQIAQLGIARTYQNIRLFNNMTALENVLVGMHSHLRSRLFDALLHTPRYWRDEREGEKEAQRLLAFVGLRGKEFVTARNLPYGDQRRLEIARALALRPRLLLLDEPTAGMNPRETDQVIALARRLRDELGITILLIEHDMKVVMNISDVITVLDFGEKIAEGQPEEIRTNPRVIEAYLGRGVAAERPQPPQMGAHA
jgi:branched-chain amino acid transport system ATP-binding protein